MREDVRDKKSTSRAKKTVKCGLVTPVSVGPESPSIAGMMAKGAFEE